MAQNGYGAIPGGLSVQEAIWTFSVLAMRTRRDTRDQTKKKTVARSFRRETIRQTQHCYRVPPPQNRATAGAERNERAENANRT